MEGLSVTGAEDLKSTPALSGISGPLSVSATTRKIAKQGSGEASTPESVVTAHLALFKGSNGQKLDSSYERGQTQSIDLAKADMIRGLRSGLLGLRKGDRAIVVVPPADGPPASARPQLNLANDEAIVIVADVVAIVGKLTEAKGAAVTPPVGLPTVTFASGTGPSIAIPQGQAPPTTLVVQPLVTGEGPPVAAGDNLAVHYTGVLWKDGSVFDSSWSRRQPFSTQIGVGRVVPAWDKGLVGQPVGSRVLLVVPPAEGYGSQGSGKIGPTDTMVFVIDILKAT